MRHTIKRVVERIAVASGMPLLGSAVNRHRALVLMYHNVVAGRGQVSGDSSLHLPRDQFARQLDYLQHACDVVSLETLIRGDPGQRERCRVAITFDDAYLGAVSFGVEELVRRSLPVTIFVPPGALGREMWWDVLGAASSAGMSEAVRAALLREFKGRDDEIRHSPQFTTSHTTSLRPELRLARPEELDAAVSQSGVAVGSHTWTHPNLAALDDAALDEELFRSLQWLRERYATFLPYVSYPYGLSSPGVERAAERVGYTAGLLAMGGWFPRDPGPSRFALPRFDVSSGLSLDGFRLRFAGLGLR